MANDLASLLTAVEEAWIVLDERVVPDLHENRVGRAIDAIELVARDLRAAAVQTKAAAHQHAEALREFLTDGVFDDWGNPQELDRVRAAADFLDGGQQYAAAGRINCRFFGNEDGPQ